MIGNPLITDLPKVQYPYTEDDITFELQIDEAIKKIPIEDRLQAIAINQLMLQKKQYDLDNTLEIQQIVNKFTKLQHPISQKANEIIEGLRKPTNEEIDEAKHYLTQEEINKIPEVLNDDPIPNYWYTVISNCELLDKYIQENDKPILKFLKRIEYITHDNSHNFSLKFYFKPNEYFANETLMVTFYSKDEANIEKKDGTAIEWKEGKDITKKNQISKPLKNKKAGKIKTSVKSHETLSFFTFFDPIDKIISNDSNEDKGLSNDSIRLEEDLALAQIFEEEIIPYHLEYYLDVREAEEQEDDFEDDDHQNQYQDKHKKEEEEAKGKKPLKSIKQANNEDEDNDFDDYEDSN